MARITSMTKSMALKFKTYEYSGADVFNTITIELAEGDDPKVEGTKLLNALMAEMYEYKAIVDEVEPTFYMKPESVREYLKQKGQL